MPLAAVPPPAPGAQLRPVVGPLLDQMVPKTAQQRLGKVELVARVAKRRWKEAQPSQPFPPEKPVDPTNYRAREGSCLLSRFRR